MIRTPGHDTPSLLGKFLSETFLDMMSHYCNIESMEPCDNKYGKCDISDAEWASVTDEFIHFTLGEILHAFEDAGGTPFVKKKVVQLVKIARSQHAIQLDLVSELLLYMIGLNSDYLEWPTGDGYYASPKSTYDFPVRDSLIKAECEDLSDVDDEDAEWAREMEKEIRHAFNSFYDLMAADRKEIVEIFWDVDFTFLEDSVPKGIETLYRVSGDYDRKWHERPWIDINEEVPEAVTKALDSVEDRAKPYGSVEAMRFEMIRRFQKALEKDMSNLSDNR